jgi:hypothetical protein
VRKKWEGQCSPGFGLDLVDGVAALHLMGDGLSDKGLHEDLHLLLSSWLKKELNDVKLELRENEAEGEPKIPSFSLDD